ISISNTAIFKIGELLAYAMAVNLFFVGSEAFVEFYSRTAHTVHADYQWFGVHGTSGIAMYSWFALICNSLAFVIFVVPALRNRLGILALGCVFAFSGVFIEKGMGLLLPGMTPGVLGDVYVYSPSMIEIGVGVGIWAVGALLFTLMAKVASAITSGELREQQA
ncbi:MAG: polysulfide reductase, partial [Deltaproteobacteria bacterium]|nr:polysulfide reductase [Deltaproteobacteria bacterium]